jgi:hypothetical protein
MPSAEYFRRQADVCFRLSRIASDDEVSDRLIAMAQAYEAKAGGLTARRERPEDAGRASQGTLVPPRGVEAP